MFDISFHAYLMFSTNPNFALTALTFSFIKSASGTKSSLIPFKIYSPTALKALLTLVVTF